MIQVKVSRDAQKAYHEALDAGVMKEQARALLPEGLTETTGCTWQQNTAIMDQLPVSCVEATEHRRNIWL